MVKLTLRAWSVSIQRGKATVILRGSDGVLRARRQEVYKIPVSDNMTTKGYVKAAIEKSDIKWKIPLFMSFKTSKAAVSASHGHLEPTQNLPDDD